MKRLSIFAALTLSVCQPAAAQPTTCGPLVAIAETLATKHGERPMVRGVNGGGRLFMLFANPETGTWTVVLTPPGRPACIVDIGNGLQFNAKWDEPIVPEEES